MNAIVAVSENWGIGKDNALLFHIRADLQRFKALTTGHTVVMGRRTLESLPGGRGLPGRRNLVLSTRPDFAAERAEVVRSLDEAVAGNPALRSVTCIPAERSAFFEAFVHQPFHQVQHRFLAASRPRVAPAEKTGGKRGLLQRLLRRKEK